MVVDCVAIIPARAGSKRIPGKNIKPFNGMPMIARSIEAARRSGLFDRVLVSTDSDEIASLAESFGAECPFRRPADLADDRTPTAPVLAHALDWLYSRGDRPSYACCLYATAPFIQAMDLLAGFETLKATGCGSAFAVTSFGFPIYRALRKTETGALAMLWPEHELTRSQDLPETYHDAGQFYWLNVSRFVADPRLYCADSQPVVLPRWRVQDIDTPEDWERAALMHRLLTEQGLIA